MIIINLFFQGLEDKAWCHVVLSKAVFNFLVPWHIVLLSTFFSKMQENSASLY
jgi:hypothetical protein